MSKQQEVLFSESLRSRIVEMEYKELDEEAIRQVYMEETGELLDIEIEVYHSEDFVSEYETNGFNGTIIHFYDEKKRINQIYTIPRGTEFNKDDEWRPLDAAYDIMGVFAGINHDQYVGLRQFEKSVIKQINNKTEGMDIELEKIGLGYSLGGGLITYSQLTGGGYDKVYTYNAAAPSVYKMTWLDYKFHVSLLREFNLGPGDTTSIYELDPKELEAFAEEYYAEAGKVIKHTVSEQDILQAAFPLRGFFRVGQIENKIDVFPDEDVEILHKLFEQFPDSIAKDYQIFLLENLTEPYGEEGFDGLLLELTGVDAELVDQIIDVYIKKDEDYGVAKKINLLMKGYSTLKEMSTKIPAFLSMLHRIREELPAVLELLIAHGYITEVEKGKVLSEFDLLIDDLTVMLNTAEYIINRLPLKLIPSMLFTSTIPGGIRMSSEMIRLMRLFNVIFVHYEKIEDRLGSITEYIYDFFLVFQKGVEAHSLNKIIEGLHEQNGAIFYQNGDLIVKRKIDGSGGKGGAAYISVNISSAIRVYRYGMDFVEQKEKLLQKLINRYENSYINDYKRRKRSILDEIHNMETYPHRYQHLLGNFTPDAQIVYRMSHIRGNKDIPSLPYNKFKKVFEDMFKYIHEEIKKEKEMLMEIESIIKNLVKEEAIIAQKIMGLGRIK